MKKIKKAFVKEKRLQNTPFPPKFLRGAGAAFFKKSPCKTLPFTPRKTDRNIQIYTKKRPIERAPATGKRPDCERKNLAFCTIRNFQNPIDKGKIGRFFPQKSPFKRRVFCQKMTRFSPCLWITLWKLLSTCQKSKISSQIYGGQQPVACGKLCGNCG